MSVLVRTLWPPEEKGSLVAVSESPDTVAAFAADLTTTRGRLTIREVHRRSGIPTATLGGYFAGRHLPPANRPEVLAKVLEACGVPTRDRKSVV